MGASQGQHAAYAEEVGGDKHINMQYMAVYDFTVEHQLTEQFGLF